MTNHKLSVIIPCYNEERLIFSTLSKVEKILSTLSIPSEVIVVNDGSSDMTSGKIAYYSKSSTISIIEVRHEVNQGKGASIHTALENITGTIVIIQDADLEYDPKDYHKMLPLILEDRADVVYGSRFRGSDPHRVLFFFHTIGNKLLTFLSNLFTQLNLTDMETGYKMFKTEVLKQINLKEKRFGIEPEITAKVSKIKGVRIYEVGISYYGRTYAEGKKINWKDGIRAIFCIIKYNIFSTK
jgi:glycosyltransferase involved in cell wall biosynthesis